MTKDDIEQRYHEQGAETMRQDYQSLIVSTLETLPFGSTEAERLYLEGVKKDGEEIFGTTNQESK